MATIDEILAAQDVLKAAAQAAADNAVEIDAKFDAVLVLIQKLIDQVAAGGPATQAQLDQVLKGVSDTQALVTSNAATAQATEDKEDKALS